jgi:micrococcal nuclease
LSVLAITLHALDTPAEADRRRRAAVSSVTDGDTIEVQTRGRTLDVRLLGVDTPETVHPTVPDECFGDRASRFTHRQLDGRRIKLEFDEEREDRYGRTLAYVWLGKRLFNVTLVRRGFATVLIYQPNDRYATRLHRAEQVARQRGRGLWGACGGGGSGTGSGEGGETGKCDPSYPTVCIPPPPPDLDCDEIPHEAFRVRAPDPHGFDGNHDGTGCEG